MMDPPGMTVIDYAVFLTLLAASLLIGAYYGLFKKQNSTVDYLVGNRSMPVIPTAISLLASYVSAILILGVPSEFFYHGSLLWETMYSTIFVFPLSAYIFIPTFYRLKLTSVYEYLELRFESRLVRLLASFTFCMVATLYLGVVVFAPSIALHTVAGFPHWASILCIGGVGTLYTVTGGLRAVVWTDVLQGFLMFSGLIAIIVQGSIQLGGLGEAFRISSERGRFKFLDFNPSPFVRQSTLACILGDGIGAIAVYGCQQTSVQRYCSMGSLREAVMTLLLNIPLMSFIVSLAWVAGVVVFATYADCDPLSAGLIDNKDAIVPYFALHHFAAVPGLLGLFIASLLSGALSSVSSLLNALAAVAWEDVVSKFDYFSSKGEKAKLAITKFLGLLFGLLTIGLAFAVGNMTGLMETTFTLTGAVSGPLLGVFLLALLVPWANKYGAVLGILCGHTISMWIGFGALNHGNKAVFLSLSTEECAIDNSTLWLTAVNSNMSTPLMQNTFYNVTAMEEDKVELNWPEKLFTVSYLYYCLIGCVVTMFVGICVSILTAPFVTLNVPAELLHPLVQRFATAKDEMPTTGAVTDDKLKTRKVMKPNKKITTTIISEKAEPSYKQTEEIFNFTSAL